MEPLNNIQSQLRAYVDGKIDYAGFRPWIADVYFDHIADGDSEALRLCRAIEWELADYSEDLISEELLKQSLSGLLDAVVDSHTTISSVTMVKVRAAGSASVQVGSSGGSGLVLVSPSGSFVPKGTVGLVEQRS